ncbi:MAG: Sfum_1244 family protein [Pseudomonadota bacterium]
MHSPSLCSLVQHNCNIADAKHAANYTLCTYLMKMREFCRWDKGYSYNQLLPKEEVGEWVSEREMLWEELEQENYAPIEIDDKTYDPFDTDGINKALLPKGMVYSGGLGKGYSPHFFLGKLSSSEWHDDYQVILSSEECARDLGAPPAMTLGNTIFIRRESVRRMLWEKVQEWRWYKNENAMSKALSFYDFDGNSDVALNEMTDAELSSIMLHEQGEIRTTGILGSGWKQYLGSINNTRDELMLRAAKDLFADALVTLPALIKQEKIASIDFFAGNMSPMRKQLCPSFLHCYEDSFKQGNLSALSEWSERSARHWQDILTRVLDKSVIADGLEDFLIKNRL